MLAALWDMHLIVYWVGVAQLGNSISVPSVVNCQCGLSTWAWSLCLVVAIVGVAYHGNKI